MIIVTGGAGFIGSNILFGLERAGYNNTVVVDWLGKEEKWKNIAKRNLFGMIAPEELEPFLDKYRADVETIIHMGAISTTTEKDADQFVQNNIRLTWNLWEFCRNFGKRFIFASSAATYGTDYADGDYDFEFSRPGPVDQYGAVTRRQGSGTAISQPANRGIFEGTRFDGRPSDRHPENSV